MVQKDKRQRYTIAFPFRSFLHLLSSADLDIAYRVEIDRYACPLWFRDILRTVEGGGKRKGALWNGVIGRDIETSSV